MKNLKHNFKYLTINALSIFFLLTIITSCSKDGEIGPKGDTGSTGAAGSAGTQGIPGKDGALIISGTGVPAVSTGNNGDMYLDKTASNLYGPKNASGWGMPLSLKGDVGQTGLNGSVILNGTTVPTSDGNNGDYYLNKNNADLYGPKTASGWGTPINLKGSANVVASTWMNLKPWSSVSVPYNRNAQYTIPGPVLNAVGFSSLEDMTTKGGIFLVYLKRGAFNYQLPLTTSYGAQPFFIQYGLRLNYFSLTVSSYNEFPLDVSLLDLPNSTDNQIRYVLIPAGIQITTTANLKGKSYEEVMELLKLKD